MSKVLAYLIMLVIAESLIIPSFKLNAQEAAAQAKKNAGLVLPQSFHATLLIDNLGNARHLEVTPQNDIYVRLSKVKEGKGTIFLHEENGKATVKARFGDFAGTGVYLKNGYLYTSSNSEIFRYKVNEKNEVIAPDAPEKLVTGLVEKGTHESKSIVVDDDNNIYIPIGCPSNSCQTEDRQKGSMGQKDCPLLKTSGGVWQFKADKLNQTYKEGIRYATGLRNVVAVDWNHQDNMLYVMQHGRDQLNSIFPDLYTIKQSAELPSECMYALKNGDNAGWPYTYYDGFQKKVMLAPEYGGDGKKEGSKEYLDPIAFYPAHMAPNDLLFYTGDLFPERYKHGAFIAFHGSWNRSPEPQAGFYVVFQPFKNGKPSGTWEVFADGFSGSPEKTASGRADRRPCGLAQGPDGSLYVCDDVKGGIFKIGYQPGTEAETAMGQKTASDAGTGQPAKTTNTNASKVPQGTSSQTKTSSAKVVKASSIPQSVMLAGKTIYTQNCAVCHQTDGGGVQNLNPTLIKTSYVLGSPSKLINVILKGMAQQEVDGVKYNNAMPSFGTLNDTQIANVLTFVRNSWGNKAEAITAEQVKVERKKK